MSALCVNHFYGPVAGWAKTSDEACAVCEAAEEIVSLERGELSFPETVGVFQRLVDAGIVWDLDAHYGRTAEELIRQGLVSDPA